MVSHQRFQSRRLAAALLAASVLVVACGGGSVDVPTKFTTAVVSHNGDTSAGLPVRYESLSNPRLAAYAQRENLAGVVAGARDEFQAMLMLKEWAAAQFKHSYPDPYPPWDAMEVLDWIRSGRTGGFCAQFAQVYLQALQALGFRGRYLEIGSAKIPFEHYVMEVWSNQFDKWVVMDVDYNAHFERDGVPLSALEVHDALVAGKTSEITTVEGAHRKGHDSPGLWPLRLAELYYYLRYHLKADHLSVPDEPAFDRYNDMVEFIDAKSVPWERSSVESPYEKTALTRQSASDRKLFEVGLSQVQVSSLQVQNAPGAEVTLELQRKFVEFSHFEYRAVPSANAPESQAPWTDLQSQRLVWTPRASAPRLELRGVNSKGIAGPAAVVQAIFEHAP